MDAEQFFAEAFTPESHADPYDLFRRMRESGPLIDAGLYTWLSFGHAEGWAVVRTPLGSSNEGRSTSRSLAPDRLEQNQEPKTLLFMDPPQHTRLRSLVAKAFTPRTTDAMKERVAELTDGILDSLSDRPARSVIDIADELAYPLPIQVICEMLGIPTTDHNLFHDWSHALTRGLDPAILRSDDDNHVVEQASAELGDYVNGLLQIRSADPRDDLISALLAARDGDDRLTTEELIELVMLLLIAGHETTMGLIGNGVVALMEHRDQLELWHHNPELSGNAIEEILRYDSPVQMLQRTITAPFELGGRVISPGDQIIVSLAACNRDPLVFTDPDRLDITRANANRHLSFGGGIHHCLGASLARAEREIVLTNSWRDSPKLRCPASLNCVAALYSAAAPTSPSPCGNVSSSSRTR